MLQKWAPKPWWLSRRFFDFITTVPWKIREPVLIFTTPPSKRTPQKNRRFFDGRIELTGTGGCKTEANTRTALALTVIGQQCIWLLSQHQKAVEMKGDPIHSLIQSPSLPTHRRARTHSQKKKKKQKRLSEKSASVRSSFARSRRFWGHRRRMAMASLASNLSFLASSLKLVGFCKHTSPTNFSFLLQLFFCPPCPCCNLIQWRSEERLIGCMLPVVSQKPQGCELSLIFSSFREQNSLGLISRAN